ncbi:MAG TPA: hypothetical protein VJH22_03615 [Candidatus Nanoarchaeia archaeon]|nr:hypothetical protein [Candidatus Nanoarchaeia archaeon]
MRADRFISPEIFDGEIKKRQLHGPNGWILFVGCNDGIDLAERVKKSYEKHLRESGSQLKEVPLLNEAKGDVVDSKDPDKDDKKLIRLFEDSETGP